jgi:hypothetical protein
MARILDDARWIGQHGIGRFADELAKSLPGLREFRRARRPWHPLDPALLGLELWRAKPKLFFSPGYNSPLAWPKPFVFTLHDLHHLRVPENSNAIKRAYYHQVIRPACHRATFVLTVSEYSKREIAAWAGLDSGKIVNVGNGVGLPFSPHGSCYQPILYLFTSSHTHKIFHGCQAPRRRVCNDVRLYSRDILGHWCLKWKLCGFKNTSVFADRDNDSLAQLYRGAAGLLSPRLRRVGLPPLEGCIAARPDDVGCLFAARGCETPRS